MSLIQEALHRRNAELGKPMLASVSPSPPPLPPPPPPAAPEPTRKPGYGKIILLVLLVLGLCGYGGWYFFLRTPDKPTPLAAQPPPVTNQQIKVSVVPAATNIVVQAKAKLETTVTPERTELVSGKTNSVATPAEPATPPVTKVVSAAVPVATNEPPPAVVAKEAPVVPATPVTPLAEPKPVSLPVRWPKLNITGIMGRSGGETVAFINGQILKVGDTIAEARILSIAENGVQMVFQGETNVLRVGKGSP